MKVLFPVLLFILCLEIIPSSARNVEIEASTRTRVNGCVTDFFTRQPIPDAQVVFSHLDRRGNVEWSNSTKTDTSGLYEAYLDSLVSYRILAYYDNVSTPGIDYVPTYTDIILGEDPNIISFTLLPGASVNMTRDPLIFVDEKNFKLTVIYENEYLIPMDSIREWWNQRIIAVPAGIPVEIQVEIYDVVWRYSSSEPKFCFVMPSEEKFINLTQGSLLAIDLREARLNCEIETGINERLITAQLGVDSIGSLGLYERERLAKARKLLESARSAVDRSDYQTAQADSHEAYLIIEDVERALNDLYINSVSSIYFITPFIGFVATAIASILFDERVRRFVTSLALFSVLLTLLIVVYPGYVLLQESGYGLLALLTVLSFVIGYSLINIPYTHGEKTSEEGLQLRSAIVAVYSVARKNLKRRKFRTFLTTLSVTIFVFSLIFLTSYSSEWGFHTQPMARESPSEGFLIRKKAVESSHMPFAPIDLEIFEFVRSHPEVTLAASIIENMPQSGSRETTLVDIESSDSVFSVAGILGVEPSEEAILTQMNNVVVQGSYMVNSDVDSVMISEEAAKSLKVNIGDNVTLCNNTFSVVAVFNSRVLGDLRDLDGLSLLPQGLEISMTPGGPVYIPYYVSAEKVIILHKDSAGKLPLNMVVSRVDVQTKNPNDIFALARLLVLLYPQYETFSSEAGKIQYAYIGPYHISKGFVENAVLLTLVILNVAMVMLNAVYERRNESRIMSTVGLNPSHIMAIFNAEAMIIAVVAGSLGYILGLTSFSFLKVLPLSPIMRYKVDASWGIAAVCASILAVMLGSTLPASKASLIATPSLLRKFAISSKEKPARGKDMWTFDIPIRITEEEVESFFDFMEKRLKSFYRDDSLNAAECTKNIKRLERQGVRKPLASYLSFIYKYSNGVKVITDNQVFLEESSGPGRYYIKLTSVNCSPWGGKIAETGPRQTAQFIRRLILEYTLKRKNG